MTKSEHAKKYYLTHKDTTVKSYIERNAERIRLYSREYRLNHLDYFKNKHKIYRIENRDKLNEYDRAYRKNNPDRMKLINKAHSNTRRSFGYVGVKILQRVYEDNIKKYGTLTCYICSEPIIFGNDTLEHKIPLSRGGTHKFSNLAIACLKCNLKKGTKTYSEYKKENISC
jgi:5-methylcytosine-specific restriction endonuclease McrA